MSEFVLDASVAISWCFPGDPTEDTPYTRSILKKLISNNAVVPEIWAFEIANAVFVSCTKRKRITAREVDEYLALLKALPIRAEKQDLWMNVGLESLARQHNLVAYDAAYLDLALRMDLPLATSDEPLRKAALAMRVELLG